MHLMSVLRGGGEGGGGAGLRVRRRRRKRKRSSTCFRGAGGLRKRFLIAPSAAVLL